MLISEAFAQTAGSAPAGGLDTATQFLPLILIFVVFYFLLFRPQQQKYKRQKELMSALRRGDRVITQSGIFGTVNKVLSDTEVLVEIADNVRVRMMKSSVSEVQSKTEPAPAGKSGTAEAKPAQDDGDGKAPSLLNRFLGKK